MRFYRYVDMPYLDGFSVILRTYYIVRETPCGYWISTDPNYDENEINFIRHKPRWMKKKSIRRFACRTKEQAKISFKRRKFRQVEILEYQLKNAKDSLRYAFPEKENE